MSWLAFAKKFLANEEGSGSAFMIGMLPASLALAGLAIDGSAVFQEQGRLQATADAAALAGAADLPDVNTAVASAISYAQKNMPVDKNGNVLAATDVAVGNWDPTERTFSPAGTPVNALHVVVRRSAKNNNAYPTTFLNLVGVSSWDVVAQATATAKQRVKAWVALVLDNTGSMCQPDPQNPCPGDTNPNIKINAMKAASQQLVAKLSGAAQVEGDIMMSIVPFTRDINIGKSDAAASWLSYTDFLAAPPVPAATVGPGKSCPWSDGANTYHCQSGPANGSSNASTIPSSGSYKGYICPSETTHSHYWNGCFDSVATGYDSHGNANAWSHTWLPNDKSTWDGCVTDRNQDYDTLNTTPTSDNTDFVAENTPYCPATTMMTLTDNWTALDNEITAMQAGGSTNQTIGLALGWQTLTQNSPFNPPPLPDGTVKYLILLSDGYNTANRWTGDGSSHSTDVDARMAAACANAKKDGVLIYTVFVDLNGSQGNSQVLQNCASDKDSMYFDLKSPGEIITTFRAIGQQITHLRLVE